VYQPRGQFKKAKVAFCIHNIAFQGRFWPESFKDMALPPASLEKLGFKDGYNKVRRLLRAVMLLCGSHCVSHHLRAAESSSSHSS
jgi:glycogen synthase